MSDSDDDVPLAKRFAAKRAEAQAAPATASSAVKKSADDDDDDDVPLAHRLQAKRTAAASASSTPKRVKKENTIVSQAAEHVRRRSETSDSDDDIPLADRLAAKRAEAQAAPAAASSAMKKSAGEDDDDDDVPLAQRLQAKRKAIATVVPTKPVKKESAGSAAAAAAHAAADEDDDDDVPLAQRLQAKRKAMATVVAAKPVKKESAGSAAAAAAAAARAAADDDDDDDDDVPLAQRLHAKRTATATASASSTPKRVKKENTIVPEAAEHIRRWWEESDLDDSDEEEKWETLEHNGVWFPPPYVPHGVKLLYDGKPVTLTPEQEEAATFYASMLDTEFVKNDVFNRNFFHDWKKLLGSKHTIQELGKCDFTPIAAWLAEQREAKKKATPEEKKAKKEEQAKLLEHYGWAVVDGHREKVGNFRMEIPGLFRGRGAHPKAGKIKKRVMPEDVTLNLGEDAPVPPCPVPGHRWGGVVHNHAVQWLAMFHDPISNHNKYVWFANSSSFKGKSDYKKFETARKLKHHIDKIRADYRKHMNSTAEKDWQLATAIAIIDMLALRVGNEKDSKEEADTVGCCSLRAEHVTLEPPNTIHFDFPGKDSIRYLNTVQVDEVVYRNMRRMWEAATARRDDKKLFNSFDTTDLNAYLKQQMPGLTAKVFRTYNASITLQRVLKGTPPGASMEEKLAFYNAANREVAILCNHQKSVSKNFDQQMERMQERLDDLKSHARLMKKHLAYLEGRSSVKVEPRRKSADEEPKPLPATAEAAQKKLDKLQEQIRRVRFTMQEKDSNKTVSLGTSKINYLDPRITVAWCKKFKIPVSKLFTKSLIEKFPWAMAVEEDFEF